MHIIAAKAVALLDALSPEFRDYQNQITRNTTQLAQSILHAGYRIVSGGTDNHVFLVDVAASNLTGKIAEEALDAASITVNKNTIPYDENPPLVASGIRLGTPAVTSRGMREREMEQIAGLIAEVLAAPHSETVRNRVRSGVRALCDEYPLYDPLS